ncbi:MAG: Ig-like domain-containing protein, partial [Chloroflexi bacterium]|nr:Ig-like domain-containing protein [Chloroflexota bacterium]
MEQNTEMAVSPSGAATCGRRRSFPGRPAFLLALAALAVLAVLLTGGVAQAQDPKKPAAPVVKLSSCDVGCITVGFEPFEYTDETAFNFRGQLFPTWSTITVEDETGASHTRVGEGQEWNGDNEDPGFTKLDKTLYTRMETHWKYTDDPASTWKEWPSQSWPGETGIRFQSRTGRGLFEVRNLESGRSYDVRVRLWNPQTNYDGCSGRACSLTYGADDPEFSAWSATATFTAGPLPGVKWFSATPGPEGVTLSWDVPDGVEFDGFFLGVNANGVCHCGGLEGLKARGSDTQWVDFIRDGSVRSVKVIGFQEGQTVQACIRPTMGGLTVQDTTRSKYVTIGWPSGTVANAPGAPHITSLDNGHINGKIKAPHLEPYVGDLWEFYTKGVNIWPTWTPGTHGFDRGLLDWDKVYLVWDKAPLNGDYITGSEWQYREKGNSTWQHGGSAAAGDDRWGVQDDDSLQDDTRYEFRVRSKSSAGWGPWSEIAEFLFERKTDLPDKLDDLYVNQPASHQISNEWVIGWTHPEWTGAYFNDGIEWREASIKEYHVLITQPGRHENPIYDSHDGTNPDWENFAFSMDRECRSDEWKPRPHNQTSNGDPHNDDRYLRIPCSDRRTGFSVRLQQSEVDLNLPLHINVRVMNNSRNQWVDNELVYQTVRRPDAPTDVTGNWDDEYDNLKLEWTASAHDGNATMDYVIETECRGARFWDEDKGLGLAYGAWPVYQGANGTSAVIAGPAPGNPFVCDPIKVYGRNWYGLSAPTVFNAPPNQVPPQVADGIHNYVGDAKDNRLMTGVTEEILLDGVFRDPNGDDFTISARTDWPHFLDVSVSPDKSKIVLTGRLDDSTARVPVVVTADDDNNGNDVGRLTFYVHLEAEPVPVTFDPMVYDANGDGRIDRREFRTAARDLAKCTSAKPYMDPDNPLECTTGETGHPGHNYRVVQALFEKTNVQLDLEWGPEDSRKASKDARVDENVGEITLDATLWIAAPASGLTLTIQPISNNNGDFTVANTVLEIAGGQKKASTTITVADDFDKEPDEKFVIFATGTSGDRTVWGDATLLVRDNDDASITVDEDTPNPIQLNEGKESSYTLSLSSKPSADVVVVPSSNDLAVAVQPASHTITSANWKQAVTFRVLAVNDADTLDVANVAISHRVTSTDARYNGISAPSVYVNVTDTGSNQQQQVNHTPTVASPISDVSALEEGSDQLVPLSGVFAYEGPGDLTILARSANDDVATVAAASSNLTITGVSAGTTTIAVIAEDTDGDRATDEFSVTVTAAPVQQNNPPQEQQQASGPPAVPNLTCAITTEQVRFKWDIPSWADGETKWYDLDITLPNGRNVFQRQHWQMRSRTEMGNWKPATQASISVIALYDQPDGERVKSAASEKTCVVPGTPNAVPTVSSGIADATITDESGTHQASLSGVFSDSDGDDLTITAASSDESVATVAVANNSLTVTAKARGSATITVTAADGNGGSVNDTFDVAVKAAPVVASAIDDITGLEEDDRRNVSLSSVFSDPDGDAVTVTGATSSDTDKVGITVALDPTTSAVTGLTVMAKAEGTATVTVAAQDSDGNTVSDTFDVTVNAPQQQLQKKNSVPVVANAISDATIVNESGSHKVSLSSVFSDADGDALTVKATSSSTTVATVAVANDNASLAVSAKARGTATITVTASDGYGGSVEDTFAVKVKAAPVVATAIPDATMIEVSSQDVDLSKVFSDADGDTLTYTVSSTDLDAVAVFEFHSAMTVFAIEKGQETVTVTAQDSDGNEVSDSFTVTVTAPANNPPTVASAIDDATIVHETGTDRVALSGVFSDADGDALTITAASSADGVATVSVAADQSALTVTAKARGTATITVTASDGNGGSVEDSFSV